MVQVQVQVLVQRVLALLALLALLVLRVLLWVVLLVLLARRAWARQRWAPPWALWRRGPLRR